MAHEHMKNVRRAQIVDAFNWEIVNVPDMRDKTERQRDVCLGYHVNGLRGLMEGSGGGQALGKASWLDK